MSSAQSANSATITNRYRQTNVNLRDASDWTRQLKEQNQYNLYRSGYTGNKDTGPEWIKHGNQFRYTYLFGKLKCATPETCSGAAFSGGSKAIVGGV
jgi:hypothetical protein